MESPASTAESTAGNKPSRSPFATKVGAAICFGRAYQPSALLANRRMAEDRAAIAVTDTDVAGECGIGANEAPPAARLAALSVKNRERARSI